MIITANGNEDNNDAREKTVLSLSRGTAIILLLLYVLYLWFQLKTHHNLFTIQQTETQPTENGNGNTAATVEEARTEEPDEEEEETHMSPWAAGAVLIVTTVLVSICADYLVDSIDALVERAHISRNFIGLILIPIVGNAAEHVTAVVVAVKNKMDLVRS